VSPSAGLFSATSGVLAGEGDAAGGAELAQAHEWVGHGVDAIAWIEHQARLGLNGLPEVLPQDRPVKTIEVVGHQHVAVQQGRQGRRYIAEMGSCGSQGVIDAMDASIGDRHTGIDHGGPLLPDLALRREEQQGDLDDAAELAGSGGLQIQHGKAAGASREESR